MKGTEMGMRYECDERIKENLDRFQAYVYGRLGVKLSPVECLDIWSGLEDMTRGKREVSHEALLNLVLNAYCIIHGDESCKVKS